MPAGVGAVHLEEVAGEEVRLLAALGAADLDDDVAVVVLVLRQEQQLELVREPLDVGLGRVDLGPHLLAVRPAGVGEHLAGGGEVAGAAGAARGCARRSPRAPCAAGPASA